MEMFYIILSAIMITAIVFLLIVCIPIGFGKLLFRWSAQRVKYIFTNSMYTIISAVIGSLVLTGLILLIGVVFKQQWAFSGGLLIVYTFWIAIKAVRENIRNSKNM